MKIKTLLASLLLGLGLSQTAGAVLLTFEDVPGGSTQNRVGGMPTYNGYNFSYTLDWVDLVGSGYPYGAHSGDFGILNNNGGIGSITKADGSDFVFGGIWAKKWATGASSGGANSLFGTLAGYNNGALVWSVSTGLNGSYQFFGAQAGAIDRLDLGFGNVFLADDITLTNVGEQSVPEPGTLALLGASLALLVRRKRTVSSWL